MVNTMEQFSGLVNIKIEGIDTIVVRYKTIVETTKKKNYDILDHRKGDVSDNFYRKEYSYKLPMRAY